MEASVEASLLVIGGHNGNCEAISLEEIVKESQEDSEMCKLKEYIRNGIDQSSWEGSLGKYAREIKNLSEKNGVIMFKSRIVIPKALREKALEILHSAHQGCSSMMGRAGNSLWWPGLCNDLGKKRDSCSECVRAAPSQASMPPVPPANPDYPMQQVCSDFAHFKNKSYVIIVDRFTNWVSVYQASKAEGLVRALRYHFVNF